MLRPSGFKRSVAVTLAGALGSIAFSACGSGGTSSAQTGPLAVGVMAPLTGIIASVGHDIVSGAKTGVAMVNSQGGVMGHKLNVYIADDGGDAIDAVPALQSVELHHPVVIVGPTSLTFAAVQSNFDTNHIVDFAVLGGTQFYRLPFHYVWHDITEDPLIAAAMDAFAIGKGYTRAAAIFGADAASQSALATLKGPFESHGGTLVSTITVTPNQSSYLAELAKVQAAHPQAIFIQTDPATSKTLFANARQLGMINIPYIGTDEFTQASEAQAFGCVQAARYMTGVAETPPTNPALEQFNSYFQHLNHSAPGQFASNNYDAIIIAALAMTAAKSTDPTKWNSFVPQVTSGNEVVYSYAAGVAALKAGKSIQYRGAYTNDWRFNKYGDISTGESIVQYNSACTTQHTVYNVSPQRVAAFAK